MTTKRALLLAAFFGLSGVAAGAFGAHGLQQRISDEQLQWWHTAARYQQIHAVALLVVAWGAGPWTRARTFAAWSFVAGLAVFCGTLYAMSLGGPRILGAVTPLGGLALMTGWALIGVHALRSSS